MESTLSNEFVYRELEETDYEGYIELMQKFKKYDYIVTRENFSIYLNKMKVEDLAKIVVLYSPTKKRILGAGTVFILNKLHYRPVGQIEDVVITRSLRGLGFGHTLINNLKYIALQEYNCYNVILHCDEENVRFYEKCGFSKSGVEMRI